MKETNKKNNKENEHVEVKKEEPKIEKIEENKNGENNQNLSMKSENQKKHEEVGVKEENNTPVKKKTRRKIVFAVLIVATIIIYIIERGEFLEIKEIGENYVSMFWQNMKYRGITAVLNFLAIFTLTYNTTSRVKKGLKTFFEDEKKQCRSCLKNQ